VAAKKRSPKIPQDIPLRVPAHGKGALRVGGTNPGAGRPPGKFKDFLAELRRDPEFQDAVRQAAKDPNSRGFGNALKLLAEYDDEKPAEKRQIVGPVEVHVKIAREGRRVTAS
jgi:hypothetical protein